MPRGILEQCRPLTRAEYASRDAAPRLGRRDGQGLRLGRRAARDPPSPRVVEREGLSERSSQPTTSRSRHASSGSPMPSSRCARSAPTGRRARGRKPSASSSTVQARSSTRSSWSRCSRASSRTTARRCASSRTDPEQRYRSQQPRIHTGRGVIRTCAGGRPPRMTAAGSVVGALFVFSHSKRRRWGHRSKRGMIAVSPPQARRPCLSSAIRAAG